MEEIEEMDNLFETVASMICDDIKRNATENVFDLLRHIPKDELIEYIKE